MNPQITVEQWGEVELARAQAASIAAEEAARVQKEAAALMTMDETEEAERRKMSSWDDWKDSHPRGDGNLGNTGWRSSM